LTDLAETHDDGRRTGTVDPGELELQLEAHRRELTGYCYRMLGSAFECEDAVQETFVRAWKNYDSFEGRAALRSWLYRIATNVCLDMLGSRQRRARPIDLGPSSTAENASMVQLPEMTWIGPIPDGKVFSAEADPAELAVAKETIRLAFIAALQYLPPKQRAVLILREVLRWQATEVAELLETSVASVNSALQRARATLSSAGVTDADPLEPMDDDQKALLTRYLEAFERYDLESLTTLLHEDATSAMPPYEMWLQGHNEISAWMLGPGAACRGSRLIATVANGLPAFGQYRPSGPGGRHEPWSLHVLEIRNRRIAGLNFFLDTERLFPLFGLPVHPDD
jgi:RNA polymerase sigma-70 factor, ECF subfamily